MQPTDKQTTNNITNLIKNSNIMQTTNYTHKLIITTLNCTEEYPINLPQIILPEIGIDFQEFNTEDYYFIQTLIFSYNETKRLTDTLIKILDHNLNYLQQILNREYIGDDDFMDNIPAKLDQLAQFILLLNQKDITLPLNNFNKTIDLYNNRNNGETENLNHLNYSDNLDKYTPQEDDIRYISCHLK